MLRFFFSIRAYDQLGSGLVKGWPVLMGDFSVNPVVVGFTWSRLFKLSHVTAY